MDDALDRSDHGRSKVIRWRYNTKDQHTINSENLICINIFFIDIAHAQACLLGIREMHVPIASLAHCQSETSAQQAIDHWRPTPTRFIWSIKKYINIRWHVKIQITFEVMINISSTKQVHRSGKKYGKINSKQRRCTRPKMLHCRSSVPVTKIEILL